MGRNPEIYVSNLDGSGLSNLTNSPALDIDPAWSPDGARIAFLRAVPQEGRPPGFSIFIMDADGTNLRRVTTCEPPTCSGEGSISWSPNASTIAFVRDSSIYAVDLASGTEREVFSSKKLTGIQSISWSPDGHRLAFSALSVGVGPDGLPTTSGRAEIQALDLSSHRVERLTTCEPPECTGGDSDPAWSPDGSKIAFSRIGQESTVELYVLDVLGGSVKPITGCRAKACESGSMQAAWAPDGSAIAFVMGAPFAGAIFLSDASGRWTAQAVAGRGNDCCPTFDPTFAGA